MGGSRVKKSKQKCKRKPESVKKLNKQKAEKWKKITAIIKARGNVSAVFNTINLLLVCPLFYLICNTY